ncbi:MAG: hypothetical protein ABII02_01340 [Candidatus Magasanikbacteria bacterium]
MTTLEYLRQFRIAGYAMFDFALSFLGIYLLAPLLSKLFLYIHLDIPKSSWLYFTLPIAILVHLLVGNITPMTAQFFDMKSHYILKIVILALIVLGVRGIRIVK